MSKAAQAISVTTHAPASAVYDASFTVAATGGGSGNAVTFSSSGGCSNVGATFTMTSGTGACTVKYDQAGNANYSAAPTVTETVTAQQGRPGDHCDHARTGDAPSTARSSRSRRPAAAPATGHVLEQRRLLEHGATFTMTSGTGPARSSTTRPATRTTARRRR